MVIQIIPETPFDVFRGDTIQSAFAVVLVGCAPDLPAPDDQFTFRVFVGDEEGPWASAQLVLNIDGEIAADASAPAKGLVAPCLAASDLQPGGTDVVCRWNDDRCMTGVGCFPLSLDWIEGACQGRETVELLEVRPGVACPGEADPAWAAAMPVPARRGASGRGRVLDGSGIIQSDRDYCWRVTCDGACPSVAAKFMTGNVDWDPPDGAIVECPTLSQWGIITLSMALSGLGLRLLRRRGPPVAGALDRS